MKRQLLFAPAMVLMLTLPADADSTYYDRFTAASQVEKGFLWHEDLIQTNNPGPCLTNAAISFSRFAEHGELAGIRLGMTMDEVVAAWGKPREAITHCFLGPRFWYGPGGWYGDLSLFFVTNRLVRIVIYDASAEQIKFDNRLSGKMSQTQCEKLLHAPPLGHRSRDARFVDSDLSYLVGDVRVDLRFTSFTTYGPKAIRTPEHLAFIACSLDREIPIQKRVRVDPDDPPLDPDEEAFGVSNTVVAPGVLYLTNPSNFLSISNALKLAAAGLRPRMSGAEADAYVRAHGLNQTNLYSLSLDHGRTLVSWYPLTDAGTSLVLEMLSTEANPALELGKTVLDRAYIQSAGANIISITLTNSP